MRAETTAAATGTAPRLRRSERRSWSAAALGLYGSIVLAFLVAPSLLVAVMSFGDQAFLTFPPAGFSTRWYEQYLTDPGWIEPTIFSVQVAVLTAVAATVLGTSAALALVRGQMVGRGAIQALITAPLIVPHIILAIGLLSFFSRVGLRGTTPGFVLAHTALAAPYVVLTVSAALYRLDGSLELAAQSLGASRLAAFRTVTLPLIRPGVIAGAGFAFITSFDEAVVSFFISSVSQKTLSRKLFEDIDFSLTPVIAAVGTLITVLSLLVAGGIELRRLRGSGGRGAG